MIVSTLNIGVLAHVDAGKTSLTERLLFNAGVIDRLGSVDGGDTKTDTLALERRRGITIKSAVVALTAPTAAEHGPRITLVDTPGHADFIAEVARALRALDGVVLVVSAVEGVQAQTRVLMRTLTKLGLPTLIFANKTDRAGAREDALLDEIREKLTDRAVAVTRVEGLGTADARTVERPLGETGTGIGDRIGVGVGTGPGIGEFLADGDDAFLERYLDDAVALTEAEYREELARQVADARAYPVFFGSAATGAGVELLMEGIRALLPARKLAADGPLRGTVFKIERGRAGEKIAYARLDGGTLTPYQHVSYFRREGGGGGTGVRGSGGVGAAVVGEARAGVGRADGDQTAGMKWAADGGRTAAVDRGDGGGNGGAEREDRSEQVGAQQVDGGRTAAARDRGDDGLTAAVDRGDDGRNAGVDRGVRGGRAGVQRVDGGIVELTGRITAVEGGLAGEIARIAGLRDVRIGDRLGSPDGLALDGFFAPPSLESVVTPRESGQTGALFTALEQLAEGDPYIAVRRDEATRAISVRLYGEVQKEVIESTLVEEFGIAVSFSASRTVYIERVKRTASWVQERRPDERIFDFATVGLRVDPGAPGSGVGYGLEVELGALPLSFHTAIEESVRRTLLAGPRGWEVTDCRVTVIDTAFFPPLSSAGHFRNMAALALNKALEEAGTELCEPVNRFELDVPAEGAARVLARLIAARAVPDEPQAGPRIWRLTGTIPAAEVAGFEQELRGLTRGEGVLLSEFDRYERC